MWAQHVVRKEKTGSLDEIFEITATTGFVKLRFTDEGIDCTIFVPGPMIDEFIDKLAAARDAAALMLSATAKKAPT
ncbi:MAG: hypothetical protein EHM35_03775 [Planctomycetaceae bacterium]|nr:MAG: hypothetical protein EHM35_03775 [Planctomycetaceae bacterium]